MHITDRFDSGNIRVIQETGPGVASLAIKADAGERHFQWFHFRVSGHRGPLRLRIENAKEASYPAGWDQYRACASYDREHWFRVPTRYEDGVLFLEPICERDTIWLAYFAPYSHERHQWLIARSQRAEGVSLEVLGSTLDGHPMDLLRIGEPHADRPAIWILSRQHPGETMAEWLVEGFLERLLDRDDALAQHLRARATFYVVPNMNPDGSVRGHLRTNAAGANLNREWHTPSLETSPEVFLVRRAMDEHGVAMCLDVHGDEALPYNFIAGPDGVPDLPAHVLPLRDRYERALADACPDFQTEHGYPKAPLGHANMKMCTSQIAHRFGAVAMTLEQPFKDNANAPNPEMGWSPARCKGLGRAQLDAVRAIVGELHR